MKIRMMDIPKRREKFVQEGRIGEGVRSEAEGNRLWSPRGEDETSRRHATVV